MIARSVNAAADVIHRAQVNGAVTAAGLALALDSAQMLVSPEMAHASAELEAERDRLRARVAELEAQADRLDHLDRITVPGLRRDVQHHQDGKARWRKRAETAEARVAVLEQQLADAPLPVTLTAKAAESADKLTALLAPSEPASRPLPAASARCACGHVGAEHHHMGARCWAQLPRERSGFGTVGPVRLCVCEAFTAAKSGGAK